jgi:hypothetical protein
MDLARLRSLAGMVENVVQPQTTSQNTNGGVLSERHQTKTSTEQGSNFKKIVDKVSSTHGSSEQGNKIATSALNHNMFREGTELSDYEVDCVITEHNKLVRSLMIAGIETDPVIESQEDDSDTYIIFESKTSPFVIGIFRTAEDAKTVLKRYSKAVARGYKSR